MRDEGDAWAEQRRPPRPEGITGTPAIETIPTGTRLWRVHRVDRDLLAFAYGHHGRGAGGRFDTLSADFGQLYASDSFEGAVAETILRSTPLLDADSRAVPRRRVAARAASILEVQRELRVIALHGPHLAAIGQGLWLTKCDVCDYPLTREWARALRECAPACAGFVWRARFDEDRFAYVLYSDRAADALVTLDTVAIDSGPGLEAVRRVLLDHNAVIE